MNQELRQFELTTIPSFENAFERFFALVSQGIVEIYNEFSLQHEFGVYLRSILSALDWKIQFERPAQFFGIDSTRLPKKEIDLAIFNRDHSTKIAFEFKFPRNGQYPEQMFSACRDICFLERLVEAGFDSGFLLFVADDELFYKRTLETKPLYTSFRGDQPLSGVILKPTGSKEEQVILSGQYGIVWRDAVQVKYWTAAVTRAACAAAVGHS